MGKQNSRTFFIFQTLNFFPILYKTTREKIHSFSFILIPVIKTLTTPQIEQNMSCAWLFYLYLAIFTHFFEFSQLFCTSHKSVRTCCILYFSRTNSYFQGRFYKIPGQFQDKRLFFSNSRSFPGPRSNSRTLPGLCKPCLLSPFQSTCGQIFSPGLSHIFFYKRSDRERVYIRYHICALTAYELPC